jgi:hypothetical protein
VASVVVFLAAPGVVPRSVAGILRDWSAVGLLHEYVWLSQEEVSLSAPELTSAAGLRAGDQTRDRLQNLLSDRRFDELTLCVVSAVTGPEAGAGLADPTVAAAVRQEMVHGAQHRTIAVHCILTRHGADGWDGHGLWDQWHNAVVAPEDAAQPGLRPTRLTSRGAEDLDTQAFYLHAAAAVASVSGLWQGMPAGPFREPDYPNGPAGLVVRGFVRQLSAATVTNQLRTQFADVSAGLPRPQVSSVRLEYVDPAAEPRVAAGLAQDVVDRHPEIFEARREPVPQKATVSGLALLKIFLQFFWASLRRAPGAWLRSVERRYSSSAARMIQGLAGENSPYKVIVRGVDAAGLSDRMEQLSRATEALAQELNRHPEADETVPPLAGFWRDVHGGACTLADGQSHVRPLPPPMVGGRPAVFRDPGRIIVRNDDDFEVSASLAVQTVDRVRAHDIRTGDLLEGALRQLAEAATRESGEAAAERDRLEDWRRRLKSSYLGQIGTHLDRHLRARIEELLDTLEALESAAAEGGADEDTVASGESLGSGLRRGVLALLVVLAVILLARLPGLLSNRQAAIAITVTLLVWAGLSAVAFLNSTQRRFAQLCAEQPADRAEVLARNAARTAQEAHTLSVAYLQYLEWATVLSQFFRAPLGTVLAPPAPPSLGGQLPRAMQLGHARPDPEAGSRVVSEVRDLVLDPGWLALLWDEVLTDAPGQLVRGGTAVGWPGGSVSRDDLLADRIADGSSLRAWSALVREQGLPSGPGEAIWLDAREQLFGHRASGLAQELFAQIDLVGRGDAAGTSSGEAFLTGLLTAVREPRDFDRELFTAAGRTGASTSVTSTYVVADPALWGPAGLTPDLPGLRLVPPESTDSGSLDQFVAVVEMSALLTGPHELRLASGPGDAVLDLRVDPDTASAATARPSVQERL